MIRAALLSLLTCGLLAGAPLRRVNTFELMLADGLAELEFISGSSFRLTHVERFDRGRVPRETESLAIQVTEQPGGWLFQTEYLGVELDRAGGGLRVRDRSRRELLQATLDGSRFEARVAAAERFYGLGERREARLDLRGAQLQAKAGLLLSSTGYGEYRPAPCSYDLGSPRRVTCGGDYWFYFGPGPKQVLEEHAAVVRPEASLAWITRSARAKRGWPELRESLAEQQHAAMSGLPAPAFDLTGFEGEALARANQIAALLPVVRAPSDRLPEWRRRLLQYLETYAWEARERGIPIVRPLAMQFPEDAEAAARSEAFMVGDEFLVAPLTAPGASVKVYLPRGNWTDLRTGQLHKGRQEITAPAPPGWTPIFVRNGMLLPLNVSGALEMHYFPWLGAEFFLWEPSAEYISQFHAAPTLDLLRLESESLLDRTFDWVVYHIDRPREVREGVGERRYAPAAGRAGMKPGEWFYDAATRRLTVRVRARASGDEIVHVAF